MSSKTFTRCKILSAVVASCLLVYSASHAAGLGKLIVLSSLGQPLRAEIELTSVTEEDAGNLSPKLANYETFQQAKVDFNQALSSLRFAIEERGLRHFVLITSTQTINEPFLELLVELTSSRGRLVREYSLVLDPADLNTHLIAGLDKNTVPAVQTNPLIQPAVIKPSTSIPPQARETPTKYYQIKEGDTLGKIANQFKAQGISLEQMLVALQRSNSAALINNNVNLIRAGSILAIPSAEVAKRINRSEAKQIVLAQSTDFTTYRNRLANQVLQMPAEEGVKTKKIDSGKITAKVIELPTPVNAAKDKLKLSKEPLPETAASQVSEEEKIAKKQALAEASTRLKELEQNTVKLQEILALQSQEPTKNTPPAQPTVLPTIQADVVTPESRPMESKDWFSYLPYGVALLALLAAIGGYFSKRKKISKSIKNGNHLFELDENTPDDEAAINHSRLPSSEATMPVKLRAEEEADPLAQAERFMTSGHPKQAEEILIEALHAQPDHHAARLKLLEIYLHRQDTRSFETIARQLHKITEGVGANWEQAASMGLALDSQNPLYAIKKAVPILSSAFAMAAEINQSIDEVLQPKSEIKQESEEEENDVTAFDFSVSTPKQEKLVQVETQMVKSSEEQATVSEHLINFDFSGIDLELPKTSAEAQQEKG